MEQGTIADLIAAACARHGVKRAFGVPGGGSSLDMIEALARRGIDFVLCRTETGATLAASADAELRNGFGVAIATQGPGAASAMNGLAHASLDRAPVLFISDGWTEKQRTIDTHQVFDQRAMSAPVVKASSRLEGDDPAHELAGVIEAMLRAPWGPAHLELTGENAKRSVRFDATTFERSAGLSPSPSGGGHGWGHSGRDPVSHLSGDAAAHGASTPTLPRRGRELELLRAAKKPVLLVGLEAREEGAPRMLAQLAERLQCPVLTTYKGKGVVSDESEWIVGHFTGGAAEAESMSAADLIVFCGLDPVELIGKPWPYKAPVLDVSLIAHPVHYVQPDAALHGPLAANLESLLPACRASQWGRAEIVRMRTAMRERLAYAQEGDGLTPQAVVQGALRAAGASRPGITVDAGAHMFSAMAFWDAAAPGGALISNGLATMAYALPAGIARALHAPQTPTVVFTGDGGLMMCAGELATAAQSGARVCVIVFNDGALSLIALKQRNRGMAEAGVAWDRADFASVARGFGLRAFTVRDADDYEAALAQAFAADGPCLIDVHVDPSGYRAQARALRG